MCGRYFLADMTWAEYREVMTIVVPDDVAWEPRFNIAPTQNMPVVHREAGPVQAEAARWGLIPAWHREAAKTFRQTTFNARIETAAEKPTFRASWTGARCLVPASGYFEWTGLAGAKQPWVVRLSGNAAMFFFAGLMARRADGTLTYTILTREADPAIAHLHPRMPVILRDDEVIDWLDQVPEAPDQLGTSFGPRLDAYRVGPVRGDSPDLIERERDLFS